MIRTGISTIALALLLAGPGAAQSQKAAAPSAGAATPAGADAFLKRAEAEYKEYSLDAARIAWLYATYINDDTSALVAKSGAKGTEMAVRFALEAAKYDKVQGLSPDTRRQLNILRSRITSPAPTREGAASALSQLQTDMQTVYGTGKGTLKGQPISGSDIEAAMGTNRNPDELKEMWTSWHDNVGAPQRQDYQRAVGLLNEGARELGYKDVGSMWRSNYDMPPEEFAKLTDKLWNEVKPLYESLHTYVRWKLNEKYGDAVQSKTGPIRADLLGNMWAQEWGNIYDVVAPPGSGDVGYDIGELLVAKDYDAIKMVKTGEAFYSSLGLDPMPETFWKRSQFLKPADREVQCHASAWNLDDVDDLRIKMCIKVNSDDFITIQHELGHNYYQRAYNKLPILYRDGANDGFHEAIGDFAALSITPDYLVQVGLLDESKVPSADKDTGLLLRQAMDKVAFLPFGLLIDKWRWGVFSGGIPAGGYQGAWDALRLQYQGIVPPVKRDETKFDPAAKYHIPANVPYTRYFLARLLQFQFYKAACDQAGWQGPLHRCSFYGNKEVGAKLNAMLEMGSSKPWPDALEAFTGSREMSGAAMVEYFAPLKGWLDEQNKGKPTGW
ncbi:MULTISPECIES: M2 family metallopeptidase [unclassified Sphingomonas]|uniref:M2 family metallopeptidase n=1 Tax=unclassified Sphingomonas TaxID=196159 RepID=UPI002150C406|nr:MULTISPECIES: M2 family metallopeptidase [unclassified Sphingomonas]MCR5872417.1 M2 family metallopeptidase [Sphingomonas sp. J344]UUX99299.1 M2 family metallopeptidase [Sphingomonas sp. J315]